MNFLLWSLQRARLSIIYSFIFFVRKYLGIFFSVFGKAISQVFVSSKYLEIGCFKSRFLSFVFKILILRYLLGH